MSPVILALDVLILDAEVQPRETMSTTVIDDYAKLYAEGHALPPISVVQEDIDYWVADGFHRVSGARQAGLTAIAAEVVPGTKRDAILVACGSNKHGKARTNEDKRRAVLRMLNDPDWRAWSNLKISQHCGVTEGYVRKLRRAWEIAEAERTGGEEIIPSYNTTPDDLAELIAQQPEVALEVRQELETGELHADDLTRGEIEALFPTREAPALILTPADEPRPAKRPTFNLTNDMVEWAKWTWNPVTGCEHNCVYCYARDIATRYYPEQFTPTFRPERLQAPQFTKRPAAADTQIGWRNVFVCSMADLFGKWVPQAWIDAVMAEVRTAPQWNFLFLTKFPQRLVTIDWPANAWVGTTVDEQYRVKIAEQAFRDLQAPVKWLSCEPLRERLTFRSLDMFDWLVIGGQSASTQAPAFQPPWEWVEHLHRQARAAKLQIYYKKNLASRPKEYPGAGGEARPGEHEG